jgi:hypothetical protein
MISTVSEGSNWDKVSMSIYAASSKGCWPLEARHAIYQAIIADSSSLLESDAESFFC